MGRQRACDLGRFRGTIMYSCTLTMSYAVAAYDVRVHHGRGTVILWT
jgi:hypothetical protein